MNKKKTKFSFDQVADIYDQTRTVPDFVLQKAFSIINDKISLGENRVVLDAGIGTGRICGSLLQYDVELTGIDISPKMLRKCVEINKDEFSAGKIALIRGDITRLPFESSTFQTVIAMHVLNFAGKKALEEIRRVMNPNGFLIIMDYTNPLRETIIAKKYAELHRLYCSPTKKEKFRSICESLKLGAVFDKTIQVIDRKKWYRNIEKFATLGQSENIAWTQCISTSQILYILEKKVYSDYWNTPDEIQSRIMQELKEWTKEKDVGDSEVVECSFEVQIFKF